MRGSQNARQHQILSQTQAQKKEVCLWDQLANANMSQPKQYNKGSHSWISSVFKAVINFHAYLWNVIYLYVYIHLFHRTVWIG